MIEEKNCMQTKTYIFESKILNKNQKSKLELKFHKISQSISIISEEDLDLNEVPINEINHHILGKRTDYIGNYLGMKIIFRVVYNELFFKAESIIRQSHQVKFLPSFYGICYHSELGYGLILSFTSGRDILQATQENSNLKKEIVVDLTHMFYYFNCRGIFVGGLNISSLSLENNKLIIHDITEILIPFIEININESEKRKVSINQIGFSSNKKRNKVNKSIENNQEDLSDEEFDNGFKKYPIVPSEEENLNTKQMNSNTKINPLIEYFLYFGI